MRDLKRDLELCERATPGPWKVEHKHKDCTPDDDECAGLGLEILGPPKPHCWGYALQGQFARSADAKFIAEAREGWPATLEERARLEQRVRELEAEVAALREALIEIADAPDKTWKPMQVFRTDEQVLIDDALHQTVITLADIARNALGLPEWGTLEQIKQGTAREALDGDQDE